MSVKVDIRRPTVLAAVPALALCLPLAVATPSALALSRRQADRIALRALMPQRINPAGGVVVLGLSRPLGSNHDVSEARPGTYRLRPLGRRTWLYWLDPAYGAAFTHPSTLLLIDDRTGRVLARRALDYWPLIDGSNAAFFTGEPQRERGGDKPFRVYAKLPRAVFPAGARAARNYWIRLSGPFAAPVARASNAFKDSCLVMAGNFEDFPKDFNNIENFFKGHGVPGYRMPNTDDLDEFVKKLPASCKDVIIYLSGHEGSEGGIIAGTTTKRTKVRLERNAAGKLQPIYKETVSDVIIPVAKVKTTIQANATRTFKLIVDACYSGLFINSLNVATPPNLLVAVTSSGATQASWALSTGGFTNGLIKGMTEVEPEVMSDTSGADPVARKIELGSMHPHGVFSGRWQLLDKLPPLTTGATGPTGGSGATGATGATGTNGPLKVAINSPALPVFADANGSSQPLQGSVSGGTPPYTATIDWGDGTTTSGTSGSHLFPQATSLDDGKMPFTMTFRATDSKGAMASTNGSLTLLCAGTTGAGFTADLGAGSMPTIRFCGHWTGGFVPSKVRDTMAPSGPPFQISGVFNIFEDTDPSGGCPVTSGNTVVTCPMPKPANANPSGHFGGIFNINMPVVSGMKIKVEGLDAGNMPVQTFIGTVP